MILKTDNSVVVDLNDGRAISVPEVVRLHTGTRIKDDIGIRRYRARFCTGR